ncbi:hypothetical protein JCM10450v2_007249 [Rhodotorula kratochvilovae]
MRFSSMILVLSGFLASGALAQTSTASVSPVATTYWEIRDGATATMVSVDHATYTISDEAQATKVASIVSKASSDAVVRASNADHFTSDVASFYTAATGRVGSVFGEATSAIGGIFHSEATPRAAPGTALVGALGAAALAMGGGAFALLA